MVLQNEWAWNMGMVEPNRQHLTNRTRAHFSRRRVLTAATLATVTAHRVARAAAPALKTKLRRVDSFERPARFIAKDRDLEVLDTRNGGALKPLFRVHKDNHSYNSQISVTADGRDIVVSDGKTIWQVAPDGAAVAIAALDEMKPSIPDVPIGNGTINWFLRTSTDGKFVHFVLHRADPSDSYVCRLHVATKRLDLIPSPHPVGIDIDDTDGLAYVPVWPGRRDRAVHVANFSGKSHREYPLSRRYASCALSDDRRKLLLSQGDLTSDPRIALLDLATGKETILPFPGSNASWGPGGAIFFLRGENSLWRYDAGQKNPQRILHVPGRRSSDTGSYALAAVLSNDKTWLCWQWATKGPWYTLGGMRFGVVLVDLQRKEYRTLEGHWSNVAWATQPE